MIRSASVLFVVAAGLAGCAAKPPMVGADRDAHLARWGGRPLVEKFVRPASLQRLDRFAGRYGVFFFMVCFMIPIFQADAMSYVAGLSSLSARKFIVANLLGRLPGVVVMTAIGAFGLALSPVVWIIFVVGGVILLAIGRLVLKKLDSESPDVDQG